ncbi:MAG: DsbE family thiol:disulfide interchange protein [Gammaproteobacteria bacterium]
MYRKILWSMVIVFVCVGLISIFSKGLNRDQQQMPSALLDKPLPDFSLEDLFAETVKYTTQDLVGDLFLINVFASWCPPCAKEHDVIVDLASQGYPFIGLNYQDNRGEAQIWLDERGNPYKKVLFDPQGIDGMEWRVIGVPETFLVDAQGVVRYRHIGMLSYDIWNNNFLPMIQELKPSRARLPYTFNNAQDEDRFYHLTAKLRCLVCQNQTVLDSDATLAKDLRDAVYERINAGQSDEEIIKFLTARYGDFILYQPPVKKSTSILWFGPVVLLLLAVVTVVLIIRQARKNHKDESQ